MDGKERKCLALLIQNDYHRRVTVSVRENL